WMQRAMTDPDDIAVNPALDAVARDFLTPREYAQWQAAVLDRAPQDYGSLPSRWTDVPPAHDNHELAQALLTDPPVLDDWERVQRLTADTFVHEVVSDESRAVAALSLAHGLRLDGKTDQSEYQRWDELTGDAKPVSSFDWTMLPCDADNRPIAEELLSEEQL